LSKLIEDVKTWEWGGGRQPYSIKRKALHYRSMRHTRLTDRSWDLSFPRLLTLRKDCVSFIL